MDIDKLIDSVNPQNNKERKKLHKALSQVSISDYNGHRFIIVPKFLLGVMHEGYWYSSYILQTAEIVATYEKSRKYEAHCLRDCYGHYWYYMYCFDTVYDDVHFVYIGVKSPDEAKTLYDRMGVDTYTYFCGNSDEWCYPHFRKNESDYLWFCTNEMSTTPDEYLQLLLENNDILA